MDVDEYRAASLDQWHRSADGWGRNAEHVDAVGASAARALIERTAPSEGETVLELACGPGGVGLAAAPLVGDAGRVILSDFAAPMVEVARERAEAAGARNAEARVLDAEAIDLPDASVDVVLCRMGLMLMADPAAAAREMARVLRPGGRLGIAVWGEASRNPWVSVPMKALAEQLGAPPAQPGTPGVCALGDPEALKGILESTGLDQVEIVEVEDAHRYGGFEQWWTMTCELARPFGDVTAAMDGETRENLRRSMRDGATAFIDAGGALALPSLALVGLARRG